MFFKVESENILSVFKGRYGHRCAQIDKDNLLIFGGGNRELLLDVVIYNIQENSCKSLPIIFHGDQNECNNGEQELSFNGLAAFGMVWNDESKSAIIFGGVEQDCTNITQKFTNKLLLLENLTDMKKLDATGSIPSPRIGHSFTKINNECIMCFGGIESDSKNDVSQLRFSDDTYLLHTVNGNFIWEKMLRTNGMGPSPRESHTAILHENVIVLYGGSNARERLNDLWFFDTSTRNWSQVETTGLVPHGRSMHSAVVVEDIMYVFGGFIKHEVASDKDNDHWKCTSNMQQINLLTCKWSKSNHPRVPAPRAGHASAAVDGRIFIISGRNDFVLSREFRCYQDIWWVDVKKPSKIDKIELESSEPTALKIRWPKVFNSISYMVELRERSDDELGNATVQRQQPIEMLDSKPKIVLVKKAKIDHNAAMNKPKIIIHENKILPKIDQLDGMVEEDDMTTDSEQETNKMRGSWCLVGIYKENHCTIKGYLAYKINRARLTSSNIPYLMGVKNISLTPGRIYFIRVFALNACGLSKIGNVSGFKTRQNLGDDGRDLMIYDINIECHIYFYLVSWQTPLVNVNFNVTLEEFANGVVVSRMLIFEGRNTSCSFLSRLLKQADDNFMIQIKAISLYDGQVISESRVKYVNGIQQAVV